MHALWQPRLEGSVVRLRPLVESDHDALFAAASDPLIWEQHPDRLRHTPERFGAYFRSGIESGGALLIQDAVTGAAIGSSRFRDHRPDDSSVEIGFTFLTRPYWGTAANAELKRLMLAHAFAHVATVYFLVGPENLRSRAAMRKLGAEELAPGKVPVRPGAERSIVYRLRRP